MMHSWLEFIGVDLAGILGGRGDESRRLSWGRRVGPPGERSEGPNGWMHQDATLYGCRSHPRRLCVRLGPAPLPKKGAEPPPQFSVNISRGQTAARKKMALGMEVGLSPGDVMLDGDPVRPSQEGAEPQFLANAYCGQTAAWMKMSLATEVGVGLRDIVFNGDPAPLQ